MKKIKYKFLQRKWKKLNQHNSTNLIKGTSLEKFKVGRLTYGDLNIYEYGKNDHNLIIGDFCSISHNVSFLLGGEHYYKSISTFPFKAVCFGEQEALSKGDIIIDSDVWIGCNVTILSGVHIGQGAIIGSCSVVTKDVPPYSIFAGNEVIKYRFDDDVIKKLINIDFSKIDIEFIKNNIDLFYKDINKDNVDEILKLITKKM